MDADLVREFIESHLADFSLEALNNAVKYFDKAEQARYKRQMEYG